ncbi:MAG: FliI/YscN family ATPase [Alphaproteobacteria bacterium]
MPAADAKFFAPSGLPAHRRLLEALAGARVAEIAGRVRAISDQRIALCGLAEDGAIGDVVHVRARDGSELAAEIVAFDGPDAIALPFGEISALGPGCEARLSPASAVARPDDSWLGCVFDGMGRCLVGGPAVDGGRDYPLRRPPPPAAARGLTTEPVDIGVVAMNAFLTCGLGQRLGIFAGSGVGKTTLLGMLASHARFDAVVIALIGERGKELADFVLRYLSPEQRARAAVFVSTSDEPAVLRRRASFLAVAAAEYFRDTGRRVLFLMDSVTRFAAALREIGVAAAEPTGIGGYPASVFAQMPRLLERLGPLDGTSGITAFITVLVEGDDMNEPVSDAVRGFLDGHVLLDRRIADGGRYPAIDVVRSVSRAAPQVQSAEHREALRRAVALESAYREVEDLLRLGLYKRGTDQRTDRAIEFHDRLEAMLLQEAADRSELEGDVRALRAILDEVDPG